MFPVSRSCSGIGHTLIVIETTGAVHPDAVGMLYAWHAVTRAVGCIDRTR